jgi:hypothetical protein
MLKRRRLLLAVAAFSLSGCCIISCNYRLPNSYLKVMTATPAECSFEDKAGVRKFRAPGEVLGMPKNAPGKLVCNAAGYQPFVRTVEAQDWNPLTPLSGDPNALRYFIEIDMAMEPKR